MQKITEPNATQDAGDYEWLNIGDRFDATSVATWATGWLSSKLIEVAAQKVASEVAVDLVTSEQFFKVCHDHMEPDINKSLKLLQSWSALERKTKGLVFNFEYFLPINEYITELSGKTLGLAMRFNAQDTKIIVKIKFQFQHPTCSLN